MERGPSSTQYGSLDDLLGCDPRLAVAKGGAVRPPFDSGRAGADVQLYYPRPDAGDIEQPAAFSALTELIEGALHVASRPGTASEYHNAINGCLREALGILWDAPSQLPAVEALCWVDARILAANVELFDDEREEWPFHWLEALYVEEGFLHEAIEFAELCGSFGYHGPTFRDRDDDGAETELSHVDWLRWRLAGVERERA